MAKKFAAWREVTTEINGRKIRGSYTTHKGMVTVRSADGTKSTKIGGSAPETLAQKLLRELARENEWDLR
jgi:hypothetical protein